MCVTIDVAKYQEMVAGELPPSTISAAAPPSLPLSSTPPVWSSKKQWGYPPFVWCPPPVSEAQTVKRLPENNKRVGAHNPSPLRRTPPLRRKRM